MTSRGVIFFAILLSQGTLLPSWPPAPHTFLHLLTRTRAGKLRAQNVLRAILCCFISGFLFLFPLPPPLEKRAGGAGEENQQHLQHRGHHLRPEHGQGARPAHHLQECCCHCHGHQRAPEDAPPGGEAPREQEDLQQRQQGRQDVPNRLPSPLCHFQLGLLGHLCEPRVSYQGNDPQTVEPVTQTFHQSASSQQEFSRAFFFSCFL